MNLQFEDSNVDALQKRLGVEWLSLRKAHSETLAMRKRLSDLFAWRGASDTTVVVFGSVARFEVTSKSDVDWILLLDGSANLDDQFGASPLETVATACLNLRSSS